MAAINRFPADREPTENRPFYQASFRFMGTEAADLYDQCAVDLKRYAELAGFETVEGATMTSRRQTVTFKLGLSAPMKPEEFASEMVFMRASLVIVDWLGSSGTDVAMPFTARLEQRTHTRPAERWATLACVLPSAMESVTTLYREMRAAAKDA